jgi:hypothetical protein
MKHDDDTLETIHHYDQPTSQRKAVSDHLDEAERQGINTHVSRKVSTVRPNRDRDEWHVKSEPIKLTNWQVCPVCHGQGGGQSAVYWPTHPTTKWVPCEHCLGKGRIAAEEQEIHFTRPTCAGQCNGSKDGSYDGDYCCTPDSGECCGPGSWCCARAGKHEHEEINDADL